MKKLIIVLVWATCILIAAAWMFRYEPIGKIGAATVLLNRWTGNISIVTDYDISRYKRPAQ